MDYLKLLNNLKKYKNMNKILAFILTIIFIPMRIIFFIGRIFYWFTRFFFKALSVPVNYLQKWLKEQKDEIQDITQAVLHFICLPFIFSQQILLAFNSFAFFFQWFSLMLSAYIMTLGAVRWQPVISDAKFD